MNLTRIYGLTLRHLYGFKYSIDRLADIFYWPILDLVLWGLTSAFFTQNLPPESAATYLILIVSGILFWLIVTRAQYEITMNLLTDIWNKNLINMFVSPLKFSEWVTAFIGLAFMKAGLSFLFSIVIAFILYKVQIFFFAIYLPIFVILFFLGGLWLGFFILALILQVGRKVEAFGWVLGAAISPFCAIYYPVSVLPEWAQKIAHLVPQSYLFESMRAYIATGKIDMQYIAISAVLNIAYLILSIFLLKKSFDSRLKKGILTIT